MERVVGLGGFFFAAEDPDALASWYSRHLGVLPPPTSYNAEVWTQEAGPTVFAPFPADAAGTAPLGSAGWGLNFRVQNLDAIVAQLQAGGVAVEIDPELYPNGRFASLTDPEGNAVQLWEPA